MKFKALIICVLFSAIAYAQTQSYKRGYGVDQAKISNQGISYLSKGAGWYYDWSTSTYLDFESAETDFVPMTWNGGYNTNDLRSFLQKHPSVKYILAFNEPNFKDQANMTPSQAAKAWPALQAIADEFNLKLVSPAPNWCGWCVEENGTTYNSPYDWLRDFFKECPKCRVDYIGIHFYMGDMNAVKGSIEQLYNQFGKPIWLTEFNMDKNGMGDNGTVDEQRNFMVNMINWMEQDDRVYRYAWFLGRGGIITDLISSDKKTPTLLGKIYANMSSYDKEFYHALNTRIEAEHYIKAETFSLVESTDTDGELSVGYTQQGTKLFYQLDVPTAGKVNMQIRTAGEQNAQLEIYSGTTFCAAIDVPSTGSWTKWQTSQIDLNLPAGKQTIEIRYVSGAADVNWLSFTSTTQDVESIQQSTIGHKFLTQDGQIIIRVGEENYTILGQKIQ
jgi:hypothetical protein